MNYSVNKIRHLHVVDTNHAASVVTDLDGKVYVSFTDGQGSKYRSDFIDPKTATVRATSAWQMAHAVKTYTVTVTASTIVAGDDYMLDIKIYDFNGAGTENVFDLCAVHRAGSSDTVTVIAADLVEQINKAQAGWAKAMVEASNSAGVITIKEVEQPAVLGTMGQIPVNFTVFAALVNSSLTATVATGSNGYPVYTYDWCTVQETTAALSSTAVADGTAFGNGKKIADMEWFYNGERGDIYRGASYPNVIPTDYLVDATQEYDSIDIHFAFIGDNESSHRSEKDLTIVGPAGTLKTLLASLNTALGTSAAFA